MVRKPASSITSGPQATSGLIGVRSVERPTALWIDGQVPVNIDETDGSVQPDDEIAWSKRAPSAARRSMFGVRMRSLP